MSERPPNRPRPMWAFRQGDYDDPPAGSLSWARRRRAHLRRLQYGNNFEQDFADSMHDPDAVSTVRPRRRQRSISPESQQDSTYSADRRRGYDEFRQRLTKRRRIDPDILPDSCPPIKYGYYGQVEPGRLKMFMISCDGGQHTDHRCPNIDLGPHNVLRTDKSVYCSERKHASIILRHADDTPFSLAQLSIVAPEHGFTAPVREGMVYVAMTLEALNKYTTKIALRQVAPPYTEEAERHQDSTDHTQSSAEMSFSSPPRRQLDSQIEQPATHHPRPSSVSHLNVYTTTTTDTDLGPEDVSSQEVLDFRLQRMQLLQRRLWRERRLHRSLPLMDDFSAFTDPPPPPPPPPRARDMDVEAREPLRSPRPDMLGSLISSTAAPGNRECHSPSREWDTELEKRLEGGEAPQDDDPEVNATYFQISEEAHKVTINFRTPISGRYILLDLASTAQADNVDVQSIMASGFAGPRFFPAIQPR